MSSTKGLTASDLKAIQDEANAAMTAAAQAAAVSANARQMVLNRDPTLATLSDAAAQLPLTQASAAIEHQAIRDLITALTDRVAALEALKVTVGFGELTLTGTLGSQATQNVTVPLSRNMGATTYSYGYGISGGAGILGNLTIDGMVSLQAQSVTLRIKNTSLLGLTLSNAVISVVAARSA